MGEIIGLDTQPDPVTPQDVQTVKSYAAALRGEPGAGLSGSGQADS